MRNRTKRASMATAVAAGGLALVACGAPTQPVEPVDLRSSAGGQISSVPLRTDPQPAPGPGQGPGSGAGTAGVDGEYEVAAGDAATVRFAVAGRQVTVQNLTVASGWQQVRDDRRPEEVDLSFVRDRTVVDLEAEVDDGRFDTDVDIDSPAAPARITYPVADAGTVTVEVPGDDRVSLVSHEAAPGWVASVDERELDRGDVEIRFRNDGANRSVEFDADTDDGRLNVDIDTRTGRGHHLPGPGR